MGATAATASAAKLPAPSIIIVGAGVSGLAAAIELRRNGLTDIRILEQAPDLGGTWLYNDYPGAACDVPSYLYSFSFEQRRDWSRRCSPQAEIHEYLRAVARKHGVDSLIEYGHEVSSCAWDDSALDWELRTADGAVFQADAIVLATGQLNQPSYPQIEGVDGFAGHSFHSARWDHACSLAGKRVGVVGTGASAVQLIPEIAPEVARLTVFQRTGNWMLPLRNRRYAALMKAAIELIPGLQSLRRRLIFHLIETLTLAIRHPRTVGRLMAALSAWFMRSQLRDPALRRKVWPDYAFGCKRVLFSSAYLPALARENVEVVTEPIARVKERGIVTADGALHELDCIIWATGFKTTEFMLPMEVTGAGGRTLREAWAKAPVAHLGICVSGFPNMFLMYGPNTNTSGGSIIFFAEAQAACLRRVLTRLRIRGDAAVEVRREAQDAGDVELQARFAGTAWTRCDSWYRDRGGRIVANWPGYMREYERRTRRLHEREFEWHVAHEESTSQRAAEEPRRGRAARGSGR